jgi:hypothetical protein
VGIGGYKQYTRQMRFRSSALALLLSIAAIAATKAPLKTKKPALTPDQRAAQSIMKSMSLRDRRLY